MIRGPLGPAELEKLRVEQIPDVVYVIFNNLIAQNLHNGRSRVLQKDVVSQLEAQGMDRAVIYEKKWLDVEPSYQEAGWNVFYDKPAYYAGENYDAYFEFTAPK